MSFLSYDPQNWARFIYHCRHIAALLVPDAYFRRRRNALFEPLPEADLEEILDRVAYYHRLREPFSLKEATSPFRLHLFSGRSAYQLDLRDSLKYFDPGVRVDYRFGDITQVPASPALVKSRPIGGANRNAVLFKLNQVRHFYFVRDTLPFREKQDRLVWRGRASQPQRKAFLEKFHAHPLCDVGHFHKKHQDVPWTKPRLGIAEQLRYKFVLAIEGNDVASNLKWIMSSNSLCFMTRPRYETWFMEGRLEAGRQYVEINGDYSDLEEKILYYSKHPDEAEAMVRAANAWVERFRTARKERVASLAVLWCYLHLSGQYRDPPPFWKALRARHP